MLTVYHLHERGEKERNREHDCCLENYDPMLYMFSCPNCKPNAKPKARKRGPLNS